MLMHMVPGPSAPGQKCNSAAPFRVARHVRHSHCLTSLSITARPCHARQAVAAEAAPEAGPKKLWGGRFTGKTDPLMEKFNESLPFDKRMWAEDIRVRSGNGDELLSRCRTQQASAHGKGHAASAFLALLSQCGLRAQWTNRGTCWS